MSVRALVLLSALVVSACATVTDETRTTAVLDGGFYGGEEYEIRKRLIEGPNGPYEKTSVVYKGVARSCVADSPQDCEKAARRAIEDYYEIVF